MQSGRWAGTASRGQEEQTHIRRETEIAGRDMTGRSAGAQRKHMLCCAATTSVVVPHLLPHHAPHRRLVQVLLLKVKLERAWGQGEDSACVKAGSCVRARVRRGLRRWPSRLHPALPCPVSSRAPGAAGSAARSCSCESQGCASACSTVMRRRGSNCSMRPSRSTASGDAPGNSLDRSARCGGGWRGRGGQGERGSSTGATLRPARRAPDTTLQPHHATLLQPHPTPPHAPPPAPACARRRGPWAPR